MKQFNAVHQEVLLLAQRDCRTPFFPPGWPRTRVQHSANQAEDHELLNSHSVWFLVIVARHF